MADGLACRRCGHANAPTSNFCSSCGSTLSDLIDEPTEMLRLEDVSEENEQVQVVGFLVGRGPKAGSRYQLDPGKTSLGRHPESTIFFDDVTVSRRHAEADFDGVRVTVRDVGSLNGTYVNQKQLDGPAELQDGDVLQIGKFKLMFFRGEG
ncbi:MAG: FHA domain-containing protein [Acidimicrobiia bacterium]